MDMTSNQPQVIFPKAEDMGHRDWGTETLLALVPGEFSLKRLFVKAGSKGGLQYHHKKNECGFLVSGQMIIRFDTGDGKLTERVINSGDSFHFPPGTVHQEEAVTDCVIIEASTPHFNDRVRMEEKYGMTIDGGLPSTSIDDVEKR
jgi:mannose-6-phosphate isomerase-like protein (cupin superfamily)